MGVVLHLGGPLSFWQSWMGLGCVMPWSANARRATLGRPGSISSIGVRLVPAAPPTPPAEGSRTRKNIVKAYTGLGALCLGYTCHFLFKSTVRVKLQSVFSSNLLCSSAKARQAVFACQTLEEDKRATTNVQNRFVQFFLLSFLLFCSY